MDLQEFVEKYQRKPVDFDKAYGAQCVDLARQYFKDVWDLPRQPEGVVGASDFFFKHNERPIQRELCNCVTFTGSQPPPAGSVVIFKSSGTNKFGHIAICLEANYGKIKVFEQDGILNEVLMKEGRPQKGASIGEWNYDRLVGWLEKKE